MPRIPRSRDKARVPPGSLAWRQYQVTLGSGLIATLGFSLGNPRTRAMAAVKRRHAADNLGLLVILDDPESLEDVVLWFRQEKTLTLLSQSGDIMIGDEVRALLPRYFTVFFDDIRDIAPELGALRLARVPRAAGGTLH
jgi:hypothetical protein